jgi:hypothetical protein
VGKQLELLHIGGASITSLSVPHFLLMKSLRNLALWFVESIHVFIDVFAPTITFSSLNWTWEVEWELLFFEQKINEENKKKKKKKDYNLLRPIVAICI